MISKEISIDIIEYLQSKKGLSVDDISISLGTSSQHIEDIKNKKAILEAKHINLYLKSNNIVFWEFIYEAVVLDHLPKKIRNKILLCKQIAEHIKKKEKT